MPESRLAQSNYQNLTIPEIKQILDEKQISYKTNSSKKELLKLLEETAEFPLFP
ncbi:MULTISPECIES: HeH/LEM domain-containing protein [unclassified Enterococcus]|uniref:HeH/LEM domain-containing protein n=1 Tax=unclassified Enterococcus TaxID=2608891 RepID=UPI003F250480